MGLSSSEFVKFFKRCERRLDPSGASGADGMVCHIIHITM
jgi:hypothetical protein